MLVLTQLDQLQSDLLSEDVIDNESQILERINQIKDDIRKI